MCRKVQVLRPRTSTSGGQSEGSVGACWVAVRVVVLFLVSFLVMAAQEAKEVQLRQLYSGHSQYVFLSVYIRWKLY